MSNISIRNTLDGLKQPHFNSTHSSIAVKRDHQNSKHHKKHSQQRLGTPTQNKLKPISPFSTFEELELDRTHRAVEQILRKKITICSYTDMDNNVKNIANKLVCAKRSPLKNSNKQKLAQRNQLITNATQENSAQLEISQSDYYFNTPNQQTKSLTHSQMRKSDKMLIKRSNKLSLLRSGSAALINQKQTLSNQKRIKFIVRSHQKSNQNISKNGIKQQIINKYENNNQLYFPQRTIQKTIQKQQQDVKDNFKQDQKSIRRSDFVKNKKMNMNEVGNYKSTCDQFRIKKRTNVGDDKGGKKEAKRIQIFNSMDINHNRQEIRGWNDQGQEQLQKQEFKCMSGRMSSLRLEQTNMAEAEFIQFIEKSKQDEAHNK